MRSRLAAIVLSLSFAAFAALATAGSASASVPLSDSPPAQAASASFATVPLVAETSDDGDAAESVGGTLRAKVGEGGANVAIPGVTITVLKDGALVGSAVTDDKGKWLVAVPEPGEYQVQLDVASLPDTVQLKEADKATIPAINIQPNTSKTASFQLVPAGEAGPGSPDTGTSALSRVLGPLVAGLQFGLIIAMTAVGLSLVFGTTGLINFAHGEYVAIGAVTAYLFGTRPLSWPFIVAILIGIVVVGALAGLIEIGLWRPLRKRGTGLIQMFIISIGLSLLLRHLILLFFGSGRQQYVQATNQTPISIGPVQVAPRDLVIMGLSVVVLIGVALMLQKTRMGKAMRALADNRDLAEASGIDVQKVIVQVWVLGGGLAALGGVFYGLKASVTWDMGYNLLLLMFAGIILGGLGSAYGAILGSLVIGIVAQGSSIWFPTELQNAWALLVMIVVLLVRPQGILGRLQRAG